MREGKIFRAVGKNDKVSGASLSTTAVWKIVLHYAHQVGFERLAPHDLRRTCAKLCRKSGAASNRADLLKQLHATHGLLHKARREAP